MCQVECPEVFAGTCVAGLTPDRCGCCQVGTRGTWPTVYNVTCQVCARSEAELCDVSVVDKYGVCGDNLECVHQQEEGEMICVCRETGAVCGSDGLSYSTPCHLNQVLYCTAL